MKKTNSRNSTKIKKTKMADRKSTRLNSSHLGISYADMYTLSLHDALPILTVRLHSVGAFETNHHEKNKFTKFYQDQKDQNGRSEEHTSELQSLRHLVCRHVHSFPTRCSSDLNGAASFCGRI